MRARIFELQSRLAEAEITEHVSSVSWFQRALWNVNSRDGRAKTRSDFVWQQLCVRDQLKIQRAQRAGRVGEKLPHSSKFSKQSRVLNRPVAFALGKVYKNPQCGTRGKFFSVTILSRARVYSTNIKNLMALYAFVFRVRILLQAYKRCFREQLQCATVKSDSAFFLTGVIS